MEQIGVRELRQHARVWLARAESGESFEITDRGRPIATLSPLIRGPWDRLVAAGAVRPRTAHDLLELRPLDPGKRALSGVIAADRDDR